MRGNVSVVGMVTGGHRIEDIDVYVPHKVMVTISAEQALKSKDLWRAIQQSCLFMLDNSSFSATAPPEPKDKTAALKAENQRLLRENQQLEAEVQRLKAAGTDSQGSLTRLQEQLAAMTEVLARIEKRGPDSRPKKSNPTSVPADPDVVGGEAPAFFPDSFKPKDVGDTHVQIKQESSDATHLDGATSKLRQLRKKKDK